MHGHRNARGTSLLEALIGSLVVSIGLLTAAQWQNRLREASALARQQTEAIRRAQLELEGLRAGAGLDGGALPPNGDAADPAPAEWPPVPGEDTRYTVDRERAALPQPALTALAITVHWSDRRHSGHRLRLDSLLADQPPALALALARPPAGRDAPPVLGRHAAIPHQAHDLDDRVAVFKPVNGGSEAWLLDRRSGRVVARCEDIAPGLRNHHLGAAELSACRPMDAVLVSGRVRFALAAPPAVPDAAAATDAPLPLTMALALDSLGHAQTPVCHGEPVMLVRPPGAGPGRGIAVPDGTTPADEGLTGWTPLGDRHWRFHCAVALAPGGASTPPHWSGRLVLMPIGWTLGNSAGSRRVCRYSADTDDSGDVDRAAEQPARQNEVEDMVREQNLLVVDGRQRCPARAAAGPPGGLPRWSGANPATVDHQP